MKHVSWVLALVVGLIVGFSFGRTSGSGGAAATAGAPRKIEDPRAVYRVPVEGSPAKGPADALVTVVESSDFQCPYCKRGADTLKQLERAYPGQLRIVFKHNPLPMHPKALPAALIAEAVRDQGGDAAFWGMHDKLFELAPGFDEAALDAAVADLGVDASKAKDAVQARTAQARIERDQKLVMSLGATGTPAFFINGRKLVGAQPLDKFRAVVDEELAKARRLVEGGTPAAEVYAKLTERGATTPVYILGAAPAPIPAAARAVAPGLPARTTAAAPALERPAPEAQAPRAPPPPPAAEYRNVPVRADDPARGAKNAKLTVVLFSDFQCPFCGRVEPTVKQLLEEFPDVRVVWKHQPLPMHPNAIPAALGAEAAREQGKFWEFHDKLFQDQRAISPDDQARIAGELGLDTARWKAAVAGKKYQARIAEDQKLAGEVGAAATPTLFFNCRQVVGAYPIETMRQVAQEELAKADKLLAGKKPGPTFYDDACKASISEGAKALGALPPALKIRPDDPSLGKAGAPVTLVLFSDFQCPFCSRVEPTLKQVKQAYGDKVRVVWKHQPLGFHPNAMPAALAAEAAREQGKFWEFHDKLFENQTSLSDQLYEQIAAELRLDLGKWKSARTAPRLQARISEDQAIATQVGAQGTPTMFVNGQKIPGAASFDVLKAAIDQQLAMKK
jgi:protein-disulfide isomerase